MMVFLPGRIIRPVPVCVHVFLVTAAPENPVRHRQCPCSMGSGRFAEAGEGRDMSFPATGSPQIIITLSLHKVGTDIRSLTAIMDARQCGEITVDEMIAQIRLISQQED